MPDSPPLDPPRPDPRHPDADAFVAQVQPDQLPPSNLPGIPADWPAIGSVPVSVLIPVKNEQINIVECLRHLSWADELIVVDSQSTDQTIPLAQAMNAQVYQFHYDKKTGWPKKRNWALENIPWKNQWVMIMDADEHPTPLFAREVEQVVTGQYKPDNPKHAGTGDAYWLNRRFMFMGRWIKHCGYYPSYNIRLLKHDAGRYERIGNLGDTGSGDNEVHEHIVLKNGIAGYLQNDFLHYAYPDLTVWIEKHNRYTSWEAHAMMHAHGGDITASPFGSNIERKRWIKQVAHHLPFRPTLRFLYCYVFKLGFLDGYPGFIMSRLMGWYEMMSMAKHFEMQLQQKRQNKKNTKDKRDKS